MHDCTTAWRFYMVMCQSYSLAPLPSTTRVQSLQVAHVGQSWKGLTSKAQVFWKSASNSGKLLVIRHEFYANINLADFGHACQQPCTQACDTKVEWLITVQQHNKLVQYHHLLASIRQFKVHLHAIMHIMRIGARSLFSFGSQAP
jgi:hypothetical protein